MMGTTSQPAIPDPFRWGIPSASVRRNGCWMGPTTTITTGAEICGEVDKQNQVCVKLRTYLAKELKDVEYWKALHKAVDAECDQLETGRDSIKREKVQLEKEHGILKQHQRETENTINQWEKPSVAKYKVIAIIEKRAYTLLRI